jgi:hypothetical protein
MMSLIRVSLLLIVSILGLAGLYGSAPERVCTEEAQAEFGCVEPDDLSVPGSGDNPIEPPRRIPSPVVSINDRGEGLAAYADNGEVIVRRFNGTPGFSEPVTVAAGVEEDLDVVAAGGVARIAWRGSNGQISVLSGQAQTGNFDAQVELAASDADDPMFTSGRHSSLGRSSLAWRVQEVGSTGLPLVQGYGSSSLQAPHTLLTRYGPGEDVSATVFDLRTATGGAHSIAVWTAGQRSDSVFAHVYVAVSGDGQWNEARSLVTVQGGVGSTAVDMDENGNAIVLWAQHGSLFFSRYLASFDSWSEPMLVRSEGNALLRDVQIDVAPNGRAIAAWTVGNALWSAAGDVSSGIWTDIQQLDLDGSTPLNGRDPRVAIDQFGRAVVVWRNDDRVYANEHDPEGWRPPELLGAAQSAPDLDMNDAGLAVAVWWSDGLQSRIWSPREALQASFTFSPDPGVVGLGMLFDPRASGGPFPITRYEWDWTNDGSFDLNDPTQTGGFETPGTYTTLLRVTDSAGQTAETTRTVNIVAVGEVSSQAIVNYRGPADGLLEIHSTEPGFAPIRCGTTTPAGQPTNTGTCSATVLAGYDVRIVAEYDPLRAIFSGWPDGFRECRNVVTTTIPTGMRAECHFAANNFDRRFEVTFQVAPPTTEILRVELHHHSLGGGDIFSSTGSVYCIVQNQLIERLNGGNCNYSFERGTSLHIFAAPQVGGSGFVGWQGCDSQPSHTECVVSMTRLRVITAQFSGG